RGYDHELLTSDNGGVAVGQPPATKRVGGGLLLPHDPPRPVALRDPAPLILRDEQAAAGQQLDVHPPLTILHAPTLLEVQAECQDVPVVQVRDENQALAVVPEIGLG